jgi:hypothetical protein
VTLQRTRVENGDRVDSRTHEVSLQPSADDFYLGEFGHGYFAVRAVHAARAATPSAAFLLVPSPVP